MVAFSSHILKYYLSRYHSYKVVSKLALQLIFLKTQTLFKITQPLYGRAD